MPKVKDPKTGKIKHFRYDKAGMAMAEKMKEKNKAAKHKRYA